MTGELRLDSLGTQTETLIMDSVVKCAFCSLSLLAGSVAAMLHIVFEGDVRRMGGH